ncbi:MAG: hypothetical protein WAS33_13225 [Candidatus Promineifilaceae bacterium]
MPDQPIVFLAERASPEAQAESPLFQVAVNTLYRDKVTPGSKQFWRFNMTFRNVSLNLPQLLDHIRRGFAWTAPHRHIRHHRPIRRNPNYYTTYRVKANVMGSQLLALDSDTGDERSHFDTLLADTFIAQYAALLHSTASATPSQPRSRILFLLETMLSPTEYEVALKALLHRFPFCDRSVNHAAVVFYGAKQCDYYLTHNILPLTVLEEQILAPFTRFRERQQAQQAAERAARLATYGSRTEPAAGQVTRYVQALTHNLLTRLAGTPSGQGLRHRRLYTASLTLGGLMAAPWLTEAAQQYLRRTTDDLFEAAVTNGYVAQYGEEDALRTIDDGLAQGEQRPLAEPVWYAQKPFLQVGDAATAVVGGEKKGEGRVTRLRETAHWEYELDSQPNVWFARSLLLADETETPDPDTSS